jgi:hypothetical protein
MALLAVGKTVPALHQTKFRQRSSVAERVRNDAPAEWRMDYPAVAKNRFRLR